uniref:Uncharacterized protein n=1 Tax=Photinus pyralis TaxID=7054 RepID=A0A1Y1M5J5_PHOPY
MYLACMLIALAKKVGKRPNCANHGGHTSELLFGIRIDWWRSAPPMSQNLEDLAEAPGTSSSSTEFHGPQNLKVWSILNNQLTKLPGARAWHNQQNATLSLASKTSV